MLTGIEMNPYLPFCLYVAARVFVQLLRKVSEDSEIRSSLEFLLTAMDWLKRHNPLSESFLIQLTLDIRASGLADLLQSPDISAYMKASKGVLGAVSTMLHRVFLLGKLITPRSAEGWKKCIGLWIRSQREAVELLIVLH